MHNLFYISECLSTNDEILNILLQKKLKFASLYTFKQTKGKGQYGNSWESSENVNIAFSLAVECEATNCPQNLFNFHTANILRKFLANMTNAIVEIKWPNDIIIKNKKISGMLTEKKKTNENSFYVVGIGINALQQKFENLPKAGSILTQTGLSFDLHHFSEQLHHYFMNEIFVEKTPAEILGEYNEHLYRKDKVSTFELNGLRQNGIIHYCDEDGNILIDLENDGLKRFYNKEIAMLY